MLYSDSSEQVWGVTISGTILQNALQDHLPREVQSLSIDPHNLAYGLVSSVRHMEEPTKRLVQDAFAASTQKIWLSLLVMSAAGLLVSLAMKGLPLHTTVDETWGVDSSDPSPEPEKQRSSTEPTQT